MQAVCADSRTKAKQKERGSREGLRVEETLRDSSCKKVDVHGRGREWEAAQERKFSGKRNLWKKEKKPEGKKPTAEGVKGWERKNAPEGYSGTV